MHIKLVVLLITMATQVLAGDNYLFKDNLFTNGDIITEKDFSTFESVVFERKQTVSLFDIRQTPPTRVNLSVFIFKVKFVKGDDITIYVNAEFETKNKAEEQAIKYAKVLGQVPNFLRTKKIKKLTIHKGTARWGAINNDGIFITTEGFRLSRVKYVEEAFLHEAGHMTLDPWHNGSINLHQWTKAAKADNKFISRYATVVRMVPHMNSEQHIEDIAETITWWIAVRCTPDRISKKHYEEINEAIPNRLKYLDEQNYDTYPLVCRKQFNSTEIGQDFKKLSKSQRINIQTKLKSLGHYNSSIDGVFGRNTSKAIEAFVKDNYANENFTSPLNSDIIFQSILMLKI